MAGNRKPAAGDFPFVAIIGGGRVGRTLGRLLRRAGYPIAAVACRSMRSARAARRFIGVGEATVDVARAAARGRLILLTVPDDAIAPACRRIAAAGLRGKIVLHACGGLTSAVLATARRAGARVGSIHPIRSFADPAEAVRRFAGTPCGYEGDAAAEPDLRRMIRRIGGVPLRIRGERKALYHAATVFASNYVVASLNAAARLMEQSGVPRRRAMEALLGLAAGTVENLRRAGLPGALTGPVERGDAAMVRRHLAAMDRETAALYRALGRETVRVARAKGSIRGARAREMERVFA